VGHSQKVLVLCGQPSLKGIKRVLRMLMMRLVEDWCSGKVIGYISKVIALH